MAEITWGTASAVLAVPLVLLLPGWALLSLLLPPETFAAQDRPDGVAWLALAAGMTLALTPIELLLLHLAGLKVSAGIVLAYLAVCALIVVWRRGPVWRDWWRRQMRRPAWRDRMAWLDAPLVVLALVMVLVLGVRLWVVRGINVGFWGDSYQHTLITQLLLTTVACSNRGPLCAIDLVHLPLWVPCQCGAVPVATGWLHQPDTPYSCPDGSTLTRWEPCALPWQCA
jgi:hypothetical protein